MFQFAMAPGNGTKCRTCEALPPDYLQEQVKAAIEANMDMELYDEICDEEEADCETLAKIRSQIASQLRF